MEREKSIVILNALIQINNDRMEGYKTAFKEAEEEELKDLFGAFIITSQECISELSSEVLALGGIPTEGTKTSGKVFRLWMDVKAAITGRDRKAIIESCEYGEEMAEDTYRKALETETDNLTPPQAAMIEEQLQLLIADNSILKEMKSILV